MSQKEISSSEENEMKKVLAIMIMLAIVVGVGFAQTAVKSTGGYKISLMTSAAKWHEGYKDMAAAIKADYNIDVDFQVIPDDQYESLLKVKLASGEVPDVFMLNAPTSYGVVNAAANCVDLSNEPWIPRLVNGKLIKDKTGKIYALPQESSSFFGACYYNKKVFADLGLKEPKTYKDFLNILETIKTKGKGIVPFYASDKDTWTTQIFMTLGFSVALSPKDGETYDKLLVNKIKWNQVPEFKSVLADWLDLYKKGYVNKDHVSATYDMAKEAVASGKAAMMLNGEWAAADIVSKWPDTDLGAFIIPFKDKQIMGTGAYVQGFFIPKASKQLANAKDFLNIWSQPKYQNLYYATNAGFSGFKDVDGGKVLPAVKQLVDNYISTGKYTYQINDPMGITAPIQGDLWTFYVESTMGIKTPDQVFTAFQKKYEDFMKSKKQPGF